MKIVNHKMDGPQVCTASPGSVVQFNRQFNQEYPPNELFLVLEVISRYRPSHGQVMDTKTPVVCLRTGKLSYVAHDRTIVKMDAEVIVNGPGN